MQCQFINGCGIFTKVKGHEGAGPIFMHDLSIDQTAFSYFHMTQQARLLKQRKQLKVSDNRPFSCDVTGLARAIHKAVWCTAATYKYIECARVEALLLQFGH